jgi:hypothetical protein
MKKIFSERTERDEIKVDRSRNTLLISESDFRIDKILKLVNKNRLVGNYVFNIEINFPPVIDKRAPVIVFWYLKVFKYRFILNSYFGKYLKYHYLNHDDLSYSEVIKLILTKNYTTMRDIEKLINNLKNLNFKHINLDLDLQIIRAKTYNVHNSLNKSS